MQTGILITKISIALFIFFFSCNENPTSNESENELGSIFVDVRALQGESMVFYSGGSKDIPRSPVYVDLKTYDDSLNMLKTVKTRITDNEGYATFDSLSYNSYYIYPKIDHDIGFIWIDSTEINSKNLNDTVRVGISYNWNLSRHDFKMLIDTASFNSDELHYLGHTFFLYNNGVRDTLTCAFDTTQVPEWLNLEINKNVYVPMYPPTIDHWIRVSYWSDEIPIQDLPISFVIPVIHQFATENLIFEIDIKK